MERSAFVSALILSWLVMSATRTHHLAGQDLDPVADPATMIDRRIEDQWHDDESFDPEGTEPEAPGTHLLRQPIRLNSASAARLADVPAIAPDLARRIVRHRNLNGPFRDMNDLLRVAGIDESMIEEIRPYVRLNSSVRSRPERPIVLDQRVQRRLDVGRGYFDLGQGAAYPGSPYRIFSRLEAMPSDKFSFALAGEKDPGEVWHFSPRSGDPGFDSISGYAAWDGPGPLERLVVGDYHIRAGLGLNLWTSGRFSGLHTNPAGAVDPGQWLSPHRSGGETAFLRGGAATLRLPLPVRVLVFTSRRGRDARLVEMDGSDPENPRVGIASMPITGLHRTVSERAGKSAVKESLVGLVVEWVSEGTSLGLTASRLDLDFPFLPEAPLYRALSEPRLGSTSLSFYGSTGTDNWRGAGEIARDADGTWAWLVALRGDFGPRSRIVVVQRAYPVGYSAPRGGAPGRRSGSPWNEVGWLLAIDSRMSKSVTGRIAMDVYRYPGPRFDSLLPARGTLLHASVEWRPRPRLRIDGQMVHGTEEKPLKGSDPFGRSVPGLGMAGRTSARLSLDSGLTPKLRVRARLASTRSVTSDGSLNRGILLFQEAAYDAHRALRITVRLALFDAPSYAARIGLAEPDMVGSPLRATLQGRGERAFILLDVRPNASVTLRVKASSTQRNDVDVLGSGHDRIDGNRLREIRAQVLYRSQRRRR